MKINCLTNLCKGFVYLWALFAVALAGIVLAGTGQVWQIKAQRDKEKELLLVGEQFRQAVMSYYNDSPGGASEYPESLEELLLDKRGPVIKRHLRKIFLDPMTKSDEWGLVAEPVPEENSGLTGRAKETIIGVYSLSKNVPIKTGNFPEHYADFRAAATYQDWQFVYTQEGGDGSSTQPQNNSTDSGSPLSSQSSPQSSATSSGGSSSSSSSPSPSP